ncbi:MAG: hypothetical protein NXI30_17945 [bacterium]|nr:hypothetical protein [bacterium]
MNLPLDRLARPFVVLAERFRPDPFVFAIVLSFATLAMPVRLLSFAGRQACRIAGDCSVAFVSAGGVSGAGCS